MQSSGGGSSSEDEETKAVIARARAAAYAKRAVAGARPLWAKAGRHLHNQGFAVVDGFVDSAAVLELRAQVLALCGEASPFIPGRTGGGKDGSGKVYSAESVRGDKIAVLDGDDPRVPGLGALMRQADELVSTMAGAAPGLRRVLRRSKPTLACYPGNGARYVKHLDNAGANSRLLTMIIYLQEASWDAAADGGQLRIYGEAEPAEAAGPGAVGGDEGGGSELGGGAAYEVDVAPTQGRAVLFWSDARTPHEVLPCHRERWAVSLWYHDDELEAALASPSAAPVHGAAGAAREGAAPAPAGAAEPGEPTVMARRPPRAAEAAAEGRPHGAASLGGSSAEDGAGDDPVVAYFRAAAALQEEVPEWQRRQQEQWERRQSAENPKGTPTRDGE